MYARVYAYGYHLLTYFLMAPEIDDKESQEFAERKKRRSPADANCQFPGPFSTAIYISTKLFIRTPCKMSTSEKDQRLALTVLMTS